MSLIRLPNPSDSVETLGARMGKDVAENLGRILDGYAPKRSILGYFAVGYNQIHSVAHEVFIDEADIMPRLDDPSLVLAIGEMVLSVDRVFNEEGALMEVTYRMPNPDL